VKRFSPRRFSISGLAILAAVFVAGCGDGRPTIVPVSGVVLVDGKPVTEGVIRIRPDAAMSAAGRIGPDGRFSLTTFESGDGCVPGTHPVEVFAFEPRAGGYFWLAPKKYSEPNSGLSITISGPTNDLKVNLTWDGGKPYLEGGGGQGPTGG
jgi:hypothetical protein